MKISAVIPCHNNREWIINSLRSALEQSLPPDEIIVVLDRCSDDSANVIQSLGDSRVKTFVSNFGNAAAARNYGVGKTQGAWIAFLDGDDRWYPHHLERAITTAEAHGDGAYFANWTEYFNGTGKSKSAPHLEVSGLTGGLSADDFFFHYSKSIGWPTSGMVFSRQAFLNIGGFDETQLRRHDTELFSRVAYLRTWSYDPEPGFYYHKDVEGSISTVTKETAYYRLRADLKIHELYGRDANNEQIQNKANTCALRAALSGDQELCRKAYALSAPYLKPSHHIYFRLLALLPNIALRHLGTLYDYRRTWKRRRKGLN